MSTDQPASGDKSATPFDRLRQEVDRVIEIVRTQGGRALEAMGVSSDAQRLTPAADLWETDDAFVVRLDLPGVPSESIQLDVQGQTLRITAERPSDPAPELARVHLAERSNRQFYRELVLPQAVDVEQSTAEASGGVVRITLRKSRPVPSRSIPIRNAT